jgi:hypothetical protein
MSRVLFSLPVNSLAYSLGLAFHHLRRPLSLSPSPTGSCNSWTFLYIKLRLIAALWQAPATSVAMGKRPYKSTRIPETCASANN